MNQTENEALKTETVESFTPYQPENPNCTVVLANLDFSCTEKDIAELFEGIQQIRVAHKPNSKQNKGFAFVDFIDASSAQKAVSLDGKLTFRNRKIYISEYIEGKQKGQKSDFKFGTGLEKNKLFIRNLHFNSTEDELMDIFKKYGELKGVRIVTHKGGKPKGVAYVEFETEEAASEALKADGTKIHNRSISVVLSNPSISTQRKINEPSHSAQQQSSSDASELPDAKLFRVPRLQMVPRSIHKGSVVSSTSNGQDGHDGHSQTNH